MQKLNKQDVRMNNIFVKIDKLLCCYLGLDNSEIIPHFLVRKGNEFIVTNTESYKRHIQETSLTKMNIDMVNQENKEKLGIALGKILATNLVVSFEEIVIKRENNNA